MEWVLVAREELRGWGRKQKEKMREIRGWREVRQAQIMETLASREDQTAASAFVSGGVSMEHFGSGSGSGDALVKSRLSIILVSS